MPEKWRILAVDDDADIRELIRSSLEPAFEVFEACDGLDTIEKLDRIEPDIMILDIMMPLMDGLETCLAIRRNPKFQHIKVLFLSALGGREDMIKGYTCGGDLYLAKPFDPVRLKRNVELFFEKLPEGPPHHRFTAAELRALESSAPAQIAQAVATASRKSASQTPHPPRAFDSIPPPPPAPKPRPRILAVDDECECAEMITEALHAEFEIFTACDGFDAIDKIASYQPDIMIIDTIMPRMSGYQLCESLRKNARFAHTPLILVSEKHSQRDREYSLRIGGDCFLQKPFTASEILHAAEQMTRHPRYRLHPKALTEAQIHEIEEIHKKRLEKEHRQEQQHHHHPPRQHENGEDSIFGEHRSG